MIVGIMRYPQNRQTAVQYLARRNRRHVGRLIEWPGVRHNAQVSDRSQPPLTLNLPLSDPAGSGSLHRLVRHPALQTSV